MMLEPLDIQMTFKNCESTESLKDYLRKKLENVTKHLKSVERANCIFKVEGHRHIIHVTLFGHNVKFFGEGASTDMYASVDLVTHKLELQINKFKERIKDHKDFEKSHEGELRYAENLFDEKRLEIVQKKKAKGK